MGEDGNFWRDLVVFIIVLLVVLALIGFFGDGYTGFSPDADLWKGVY